MTASSPWMINLVWDEPSSALGFAGPIAARAGAFETGQRDYAWKLGSAMRASSRPPSWRHLPGYPVFWSMCHTCFRSDERNHQAAV
jgi:hypothetical protein